MARAACQGHGTRPAREGPRDPPQLPGTTRTVTVAADPVTGTTNGSGPASTSTRRTLPCSAISTVAARPLDTPSVETRCAHTRSSRQLPAGRETCPATTGPTTSTRVSGFTTRPDPTAAIVT